MLQSPPSIQRVLGVDFNLFKENRETSMGLIEFNCVGQDKPGAQMNSLFCTVIYVYTR